MKLGRNIVFYCIMILVLILPLMLVLSSNTHTHVEVSHFRMLAVSAYWDLNGNSRKSSTDRYYKTRMEKTTQFNVDYAFFGEHDVTTLIKKYRIGKATHDFELSWSDLVHMCEQKFRCIDILKKLEATSLHRDHKDGEMHCPSAELLLVWLSKVLLVENSMELWPSYTHYGWIDAGYKGLENQMPSNSPWPSRDLSKIRGFYIKTDPGASHDVYWRHGMKTAPIAGMWFGDRHACKIFVQTCTRITKERFQESLTLCTEQDIFALAIEDMQKTSACTVTIVSNVGYGPFWV